MLKSRIRIFSTKFSNTNKYKKQPCFAKLRHFMFWVEKNYCIKKYYY